MNDYLLKGDEIGHFAYGGSTIILGFEPGVIEKFTVNVGDIIQMGQQIAKANKIVTCQNQNKINKK